MWLYPLPGAELLYRSIPQHITIRMQKTIEDLDDVLERVKLLADREICQAFPAMLGLVKQAEEVIEYFSKMFKGHLRDFRLQIKRKERDEKTVAEVLDRLEKLPLDVEKMKAWVEVREEEAQRLGKVTHQGKLVKELKESERGLKCQVFLEVRIHSKKLDAYIQQLKEATETYAKHDDVGTSLRVIPELSDWKSPCSILVREENQRKLDQFSRCHEIHSENSRIGFEVRETR